MREVPTHRGTQRRARRLRAGVAVALLAGACAALLVPAAAAAPTAVPGSDSPAEFVPASAASARAARAPGPWGWSAQSRSWARASSVLPARLVDAGPTARITRAQFVAALARVEQLRAERYGTPRRLAQHRTGARLPDVAPGTLQARAVALGWMQPIGGRFAGSSAVTSNQAAIAMAGVLGLRPALVRFTGRLRREVPGARISYFNAAAQALVRTVGLRYNVEDPHDEFELGPTEALNVGHGSWMLHAATTRIESWELSEAEQMSTSFDLPVLGANQLRVMRVAVRQLGQPYVWAGETEGRQAEGHGGFDCSGYTIRVINQAGVAASQIAPIAERTSYDQSDLPRTQRLSRERLQPGDAMFFGPRGPSSTPDENYHAGVYMGNGWFIHSSGGNGGVAIDTLDGWWGGQFAWGRRALKVA